MAKFGKWIGLGLGWALGGPVGGILGLAVGSMFDTGSKTGTTSAQKRVYRSATTRGDYAKSTERLRERPFNARAGIIRTHRTLAGRKRQARR